MGRPIVMLTGKVTANAMGTNSPELACGTEIFIAAGTAIYDALAASIANMNLFVGSSVTDALIYANRQPFAKGIRIANGTGNAPNE